MYDKIANSAKFSRESCYICIKYSSAEDLSEKKMSRFSIKIDSKAPEFWRQNITTMCGLYDEKNNRIGFISAESNIAPIGSQLTTKPDSYTEPRIISLDSEECDHLTLLVYAIPHTLPEDNYIDFSPPFDLRITVLRDGEPFYSALHAINQWSGANIRIELPQK